MSLPTKIKINTRVYKVDRKPRTEGSKKVQLREKEVWLTPVGGRPFRSQWPLRLHGETEYVEWHEAA